jgi:hypothetical protein
MIKENTLEGSRVFSILKEEVVQKLKEEHFTGRFIMLWKDGEVVSAKLLATISFDKRRRREDDDDFEFRMW